MGIILANRKIVLEYAKKAFGTDPDYPWVRDPKSAVLRHRENSKWYGVILEVLPQRLGLSGSKPMDILNLKCDPLMRGNLVDCQKYFPAYHMNKEKWISALLNGTIPAEEIFGLLQLSFDLTK